MISSKLFTASTDNLKFHKTIAKEINIKISLKFAQEINNAVKNLTTLTQSAASIMTNTLNTTKNSTHKPTFVVYC